MNKPNLEEELEKAYQLVNNRFSIDFEKPELNVRSVLDYIMPTASMYIDYPPNTINVVYEICGRYNTSKRQFTFMHELGHSLECQLNHEFSNKYLRSLVHPEKKQRQWEKVSVMIAFAEGMADYIAMEAACASNNSGLIQYAQKHKEMNDISLKTWLKRTLPVLLPVWGNDKSNWRETVLKFAKAENGHILKRYSYEFGYDFVINNKEIEIEKMIKNPPKNYEEFFLPERYKQKFSK